MAFGSRKTDYKTQGFKVETDKTGTRQGGGGRRPGRGYARDVGRMVVVRDKGERDI